MSTRPHLSSFKVGAAQLDIGDDQKANLSKCIDAIRKASNEGAKLVLLPEFGNIEPKADGSTWNQFYDNLYDTEYFTKAIGSAAKDYKIYVALNILSKGTKRPEMSDETFLVSANGNILGSYQKTVLCARENDFCLRGNIEPKVFDTELGRIGIYICMDGVIPETTRVLALNGAQIFLNSLHTIAHEEVEFIIPSRGVENGVWVVSANRVGKVKTPNGEFQFTGSNLIVRPDGKILARGSMDREEIIYGIIAPSEADNKKREGIGDLFLDRRPELYASLATPNSALRISNLEIPEKTTNVKISAVQNEITDNPETTLDLALKQFSRIVKNGTTMLIVFPELFLFERNWVAANPRAAAKISQKALQEFSALCKTSKAIVALSLVESSENSFYSTLYLVDDNGNLIEKYRKTHLSPLEKKWATKGDSLIVSDTKYGNIGLALGSEIVFPEIARELSLLGADSILLPCNWNYDFEYDWIVKTRTVENHVCIVAANRVDSHAKRGSVITPIVSPFASFKENKSVEQIFACYAVHGAVGELVSPPIDLLSARDKVVTYKTNIIFDRRFEYYEPLVAKD